MVGAKWSAELGRGYTLRLSQITNALWRISVLGPEPIEYTSLFDSEAHAQRDAVRTAKWHFERNGIQVEITEPLAWQFLSLNEPA